MKITIIWHRQILIVFSYKDIGVDILSLYHIRFRLLYHLFKIFNRFTIQINCTWHVIACHS